MQLLVSKIGHKTFVNNGALIESFIRYNLDGSVFVLFSVCLIVCEFGLCIFSVYVCLCVCVHLYIFVFYSCVCVCV